jgi:hypothetical protein
MPARAMTLVAVPPLKTRRSVGMHFDAGQSLPVPISRRRRDGDHAGVVLFRLSAGLGRLLRPEFLVRPRCSLRPDSVGVLS